MTARAYPIAFAIGDRVTAELVCVRRARERIAA
jgi:hypothetical protein